MPLKEYNPHYDPLVDKTPGCGTDYAPTYWVDSAGIKPEDDGTVTADITVDTAVIGSGFTGLATALFLAKEHHIETAVLEANCLSWGCTSRNGGQAQLAAGRLGRSQWLRKWGETTAKALHEEICQGFATFEAIIKDEDIACDLTDRGHLYIAHKPGIFARLSSESELNNRVFSYNTEIISPHRLKAEYVDERHSHGALLEPIGFGVHPAKLAYGYAGAARKYGAKIYTSSPVIAWEEKQGYHCLVTPKGIVRARRVAVATGAYTHASLNPYLSYRYMPILSNSVVTSVLTASQLEESGIKTNMVMTDTRILRFYYRLLPDGRMQIGTRSAIVGSDADNKKHYDLLIDGLYQKFPALRSATIDYSWWGWVDVSHDMMPRVAEIDGKNIFYALGYGGNGVSFSAQAGKRMAQKVAGVFDKSLETLPIYNSQLPEHPLRPLRRIGQWLLYRYYHGLDRVLP